MDKVITNKHESYAMLQISRVSNGRGQNLFGSSIKHSNTITLRIKEARMDRHLNRDWYYGGKEYIEIEMSYSQFAEAITSLNQGEGVPVTLKYLMGKEITECPHVDKRGEFENEFREQMEELSQKLKKLTENTELILNEKKSLNKIDKDIILNEIKMLRQEINSNIPFMATSFNEQMDKTVLEAKGEIEGFMMHKVISAGLEKLQMDQNLLEE
jgi:uncharacterized protein YihD (DUF1040 family)